MQGDSVGELVDLVNKHGKVVKAAISRSEAHHHSNAYMQIVVVIIFNEAGQILVHKRAATKGVAPGAIDYVCGGICTGESPQDAARREAIEEVGVSPINLKIVRQGINEYDRYCYLLTGFTVHKPTQAPDLTEVAWARFHHIQDLLDAQATGIMTFVDGFFEDLKFVRKLL